MIVPPWVILWSNNNVKLLELKVGICVLLNLLLNYRLNFWLSLLTIRKMRAVSWHMNLAVNYDSRARFLEIEQICQSTGSFYEIFCLCRIVNETINWLISVKCQHFVYFSAFKRCCQIVNTCFTAMDLLTISDTLLVSRVMS